MTVSDNSVGRWPTLAPEHRFNFFQANAANLSEDEIDA